jgi:hypothetical protein
LADEILAATRVHSSVEILRAISIRFLGELELELQVQ